MAKYLTLRNKLGIRYMKEELDGVRREKDDMV
jgi:hypothetical protein